MVDSTNLPEVDINAIATDLNGKADIDLTNLNDSALRKFYYLPGDTYSFSNKHVAVSGQLSNSSKSLYFNIPCPKSLSRVNGVTLNSITTSLRHIGGGIYLLLTQIYQIMEFLTQYRYSLITLYI